MRLLDQHISIEVTEEAKKWLDEETYESQFGAKPLKRLVQRQIETLIVHVMIKESLPEGTTIKVDLDDNKELDFKVVKPTS